MKWVMIVFPVAIFTGISLQMIAPNTLSATPEWVLPVVAGAAPFVLGLISAIWVRWRRGTVSVAAGPRIGGTMWLFPAVLTRWLYLIILPAFIVVFVLLGKFAPGVLTAIPTRLFNVVILAAVVLLIGLRFADGVRRLR